MRTDEKPMTTYSIEQIKFAFGKTSDDPEVWWETFLEHLNSKDVSTERQETQQDVIEKAIALCENLYWELKIIGDQDKEWAERQVGMIAIVAAGVAHRRSETAHSIAEAIKTVIDRAVDNPTPLWRDALKAALEYAEKKEVPPDDVRIVWKFLLQKEAQEERN